MVWFGCIFLFSFMHVDWYLLFVLVCFVVAVWIDYVGGIPVFGCLCVVCVF